MKELKSLLFGNLNGWEWVACFILAGLATTGMYFLRTKKRDKLSERSPVDWSWRFFWQDNVQSIIGTAILIYLSIRVTQMWVKTIEWELILSVFLGIISDQLAIIFLEVRENGVSAITVRIKQIVKKLGLSKEDPQNK